MGKLMLNLSCDMKKSNLSVLICQTQILLILCNVSICVVIFVTSTQLCFLDRRKMRIFAGHKNDRLLFDHFWESKIHKMPVFDEHSFRFDVEKSKKKKKRYESDFENVSFIHILSLKS